MTVLLTDIETKVRSLLGDFSQTTKDIFTYTASAIFTLTEPNALAITTVSVNDVTSGVTNTYDSTTNKVTVTSALSTGDTVEVQYTYYPDYSSTSIGQYIKAAFTHISAHNYKDWIVEGASDEIHPEPDERQTNLIALIASILIRPDNRSYKLPDMTIMVPKDIPTADKVGKAIIIFKLNKHGIFTIS